MAAVLSIAEILDYAAGAGFSGSDLATAAAVAMAESSGNPQAINANEPHGSSYGLWQIYLYAHPQYAAGNLLDPSYNAMAAFQIYQAAGYSFSPWSTFGSGKYVAYLPQVSATIAAAAPVAAPGMDATTTTNQAAIDPGIDLGAGEIDLSNYWPILVAGAGVLWLVLMRG